MFLASPIWLVLLAPWAGLAVWLLRGRLPSRMVPFLKLWDAQAVQNTKPERAWRTPPLAVMAALAAMLLAIFAAAGPMIEFGPSALAAQAADVRIESLAVRAAPTTQAMVQIRNQSELSNAKLTVRAGDTSVSRDIVLPGRGEVRLYFVDLPIAAASVDAQLTAGADGKISHELQAIRESEWPKVEAVGPLPPELNRMIEVYMRHRPPGENSKRIAVVAGSEHLPTDEPAAILMDAPIHGREVTKIQSLMVVDSPLTRSVDWGKALAGAAVQSPTSENWRPLVTAKDVTVLAIRQNPYRQVWVGFRSAQFPDDADFVVLWSHIFTWLGEGGDAYRTLPVSTLAPIPASGGRNARPLSGETLLGAMGLLFLSVLTWKAPMVSGHKKSKS